MASVEGLGGWHKSVIAEVKKLGSALGRHTEGEDSTTNHQLPPLPAALHHPNEGQCLTPQPLCLKGFLF